jgi:cardiolipin synthase A/B
MKSKDTVRCTLRALLVALMTLLAALLTFNLSLGDKHFEEPLEHTYSVHDAQFVHAVGELLGHNFSNGNQVQVLVNGEEIFPAMLESIHSAQHTITFESYIFYTGQTTRQFADALIERARAGVRVHVLLDWFGGQISDEIIEELDESGVELRFYRAPSWTTLHIMNNRTHRKILVVDGKIGFTGGVDIADKWKGNAQNPSHWRDSHFRITGPAVAQLQAAFMDNWMQTTGKVQLGQHYFPLLEPAGPLKMQVFSSSPGGGSESMQFMYLFAIASASQSIHLSMAYFIPGEAAVAQLIDAAKRGVKVQIIVPGEHIDRGIVRRASRHRWGPLLEAGVEIYEYQPTMYHVKLLVADAMWTSAGSSNFDSRSFSINDESNMNVYDADFARTQIQIFQRDLKNSRRISLDEWRGRPWSEKVIDNFASLLGSQL